MHRATPQFWAHLGHLPDSVQQIARRNFRLLAEDPAHPSLRLKRVGSYWSARVGLRYRALAVDDDGDFIGVWIGTHDQYNRLIK